MEWYAIQKGQRSNSCGDTCEEALYSPSNTVAEIGHLTVATPAATPAPSGGQIHVKDVWPLSHSTGSSLQMSQNALSFINLETSTHLSNPGIQLV